MTEEARLAAALASCAEEPIQVPGSIQPHGVLLALDEPGLRVVMASDNAADLLGGGVDPLGSTVDFILPAAADLIRDAARGDTIDANPIEVMLEGGAVDVDLHRSDGLLLVQLEPHHADAAGPQRPEGTRPWFQELPIVLQRLMQSTTLDDLTTVLATEVRSLTGFDRVMIYRFDKEWNGEVIAEARNPEYEPFLGLRYPASDIPAQARALYTAHWLRLIPDVAYRPSQLRPLVNPLTGGPLDLSAVGLRSVSPVHIQYLRNMGVKASMSVSLIDQGRLWGLIACHHYQGPYRPPYRIRTAAEFLGRTASLLLATKQSRAEYDSILATGAAQNRLTEALAQTPPAPLDALTSGATTVADLIPCSAAMVRIGGRTRAVGEAPSAADMARLLGALSDQLSRGPVVTSSLVREHPELTDLADRASGVLAVPISGGARGDVLLWLRPELVQEVQWGGRPDDDAMIEEGPAGLRLTPRRSFARWTEIVRLTARPWLEHEIDAALRVGRQVSEGLLRRVEADNRLVATLQRTVLLEALPVLPDITVAVRYLPSHQDVTGGDWYDVVPLPGGRVAFVLGDVAGHGLSVTAIGAQLRHGLRAYLLREDGPTAALQSLNQLLIRLLPGEMATAIIAVVDPGTGELHLANAGHPPALHLGPPPRYVTHRRGPALGFRADANYPDDVMTLRPGEGLLLFSDGLVETRGTPLDEGLAALAQTVRAANSAMTTPDLERLCDRITGSSALDTASLEDDITMLALRRGTKPVHPARSVAT